MHLADHLREIEKQVEGKGVRRKQRARVSEKVSAKEKVREREGEREREKDILNYKVYGNLHTAVRESSEYFMYAS